ncbi:MAG: hypothetical protein ACTTI6_06405 [Treponema sp.]|uniref:hypothetical protein n=1 Tax=Treponema sp. TaxID=166 RepID=UPI003FA32B2D
MDSRISNYNFSNEVEIQDSIFSKRNDKEVFSVEVLLGAKVGEKIELVDSGTVEHHERSYKTKKKLQNKTAVLLDLLHTIKDKAQKPPQTLFLSMTAYLRYKLQTYSKKKGYDDRSVDIY